MEGATDSRKSRNRIFWLMLPMSRARLENIFNPKRVLMASRGATVRVKYVIPPCQMTRVATMVNNRKNTMSRILCPRATP